MCAVRIPPGPPFFVSLVYAYLDSAPILVHGPWVRAWQRSWQRNGWTTRLLTRRIAEKHPEYFPDLSKLHKWCALATQKEKGFYSSIFTINQSLKPGVIPSAVPTAEGDPVLTFSRYSLDERAYKYGALGWTLAELVSFDGLPIDELYSSGMRL